MNSGKNVKFYIETTQVNDSEDDLPTIKGSYVEEETGYMGEANTYRHINWEEHNQELKEVYQSIKAKVKEISEEKFKQVLSGMRASIDLVSNEMSKLTENDKVKKLQLEFSLGFTENFDLVLFKACSNQGLKITIVMENE